MRVLKHLFTIIGVVFGLMTSSQPALADSDGNSLVVSPRSVSFPLTYGEWGARWWQYILGIPADQNPLFDATGAQCSLGQWGPVFFLAGTATTGPVSRKCTVPADTGLFFPLINISCAVPEDGTTANEIKKLCSAQIDQVDPRHLSLTIDNKSVPNLREFRASEFFSFTGSAHGPFETTGCGTPPCYADFRSIAFSDGYWVMLKPLSSDRDHTVRFHAEGPGGFVVDVTYKLKIAH